MSRRNSVLTRRAKASTGCSCRTAIPVPGSIWRRRPFPWQLTLTMSARRCCPPVVSRWQCGWTCRRGRTLPSQWPEALGMGLKQGFSRLVARWCLPARRRGARYSCMTSVMPRRGCGVLKWVLRRSRRMSWPCLTCSAVVPMRFSPLTSCGNAGRCR